MEELSIAQTKCASSLSWSGTNINLWSGMTTLLLPAILALPLTAQVKKSACSRQHTLCGASVYSPML